MPPTRTLPAALTRLLPRQDPTTTVVVDANEGGSSSGSGLDGGAIAGIVIGTVVGVLLLWWIIRACAAPRGPDPGRQGWYDDTVPPPSRSRSRSHGRRHRHYRHHDRSRRRSSRRRSSTARPVVIEGKYGYAVPRRPSATYVYPAGGRSRSRSPGRYFVSERGAV